MKKSKWFTVHRRSGAGWLRARSITPILACFAATVALGGCALSDEGVEKHGSTKQAVGRGTYDLENRFRNVVGITAPGAFRDPFCTGFLASRRYVVSAAHCFLNPNTKSGSFDVVFSPEPVTINQGDVRRIPHTQTQPWGGVETAVDTFDEDSQAENDRARDVAVLALNRPVDPAIATPVRPAGITVPSCGSGFQGTNVGYGPTTFAEIDAIGINDIRNFAASDGWTRETYDNGWQAFTNDWELLAAPANYAGGLPGDSGGPLFDESFDRVCGVASGHWVVPKFSLLPLPGVILVVRNYRPALDSSDNVTFLKNILLDKFGRVIGERGTVDSDGDLVPDIEDNCPNAPNPLQEDSDGDGRGDFCDNCAFTKNFDQRDTNLAEEEKAVGAPKPTRPNTPTELTNRYPGDACDTRPLSVIEVPGGKYAPLDGDRNIACIHHPGLLCGGSFTRELCGLPKNNVILSNGIVGGPSQHGVTRVLRCKCTDTSSTAACELSGCSRSNFLTPAGGWGNTTLADANVRSKTVIVSDAATSGVRQTYVDVRTPGTDGSPQWWGWAYWKDLAGLRPKEPTIDPAFPDDPFKSKPVSIWNGMVWSWVRAFGPVNAAPPTFNAVPTGPSGEAQQVRQHVALMHVQEEANTAFMDRPCDSRFQESRVIDALDCPMCDGGLFLEVMNDPSNPDPTTLVSPGRWRRPVSDYLPSGIIDRLRDGTSTLLSASDAAWWSTGVGVSTVLIRRTDGAFLRALVSDREGRLQAIELGGGGVCGVNCEGPAPRAAARATAAPAAPYVAALSRYRQELVYIERGADGVTPQQFRTFDFDLAVEGTRRFLGNHRLENPIAITYRAEDDSYYVLDQRSTQPPSATLYKVPRGNTLEPVGTWERPGNLREVAMTTGTDGTLVITSWNDSKHAIVVLDPGSLYQDSGVHLGQPAGKRSIHAVSMRFGKGAVAVPAYRNRDSITLAIVGPDGNPMPVRRTDADPKGKDDTTDADLAALGKAF